MDPTWQLLPDPLSRDVFVSSESAVAPAVARAGGSLLGTGILRPFRRDQNGDFQSGSGAYLVRAAVGLVLGTICNSQTTYGELPWRTEFGSLLQLLRMRNNDGMLAQVAKRYAIDALTYWVPSVRVKETMLIPARKDRFYLKVVYDVVDQSGARVLVEGLQTAVPLG